MNTLLKKPKNTNYKIEAGKLAIGDKLLKSDGSKVEITAMEEEFGEVNANH